MMRALVAVDDGRAVCGSTLFDRHAESICHECGCLMTIDRPSHDAPAERVENNGAIQLAFPSRVLRDIGDPQLIATLAIELALYAIFGGCDVRHAPLTRSTRESLQACTAHQKLDGLTTYGDPES
jgi:hypothetical protein